jgi:crotonobetainyl-CoA:carnitine CoA-transferase CaiB-like acyl-CoA transferase
LANRGLSPEELAAIRPGLVYVSLCAFSHAGPSRRGFDTVVQTVSGICLAHQPAQDIDIAPSVDQDAAIAPGG